MVDIIKGRWSPLRQTFSLRTKKYAYPELMLDQAS